MDMARLTILEGNLSVNLWPEVILAMTYIKNLRPTKALENNNTPYNAQYKKDPDISHLRILGSTVYVFLHEEDRELKLEKWKPRALRGKLVGFDGHTIYHVYLEEQLKVIRIKNLWIYKDHIPKDFTNLPIYEKTSTFQGFQADDNDDEVFKDPSLIQATPPAAATLPIPAPAPTVTTSRAGCTIKPTRKAKESSSKKTPPRTVGTKEPRALIIKLVQLLEEKDWSAGEQNCDISEEDPIKILATKLHTEANALGQSQFACSTQLDVEEPETCNRAMQGLNAAQWSQAMIEELDSLHENNTWTLIPKEEMQAGHRALGEKWVYKVKRDVEGKISRFKARWVVKGYLQQFGIDFDQTYAAIVKPMAFRVLFAIAAYFDLDIDQMDVKTAFLYGLINQLIYVEQPKGTETEATKNMACKLLKALYGLKQLSRLWYKQFSAFLLERLGLSRIHADHSIFISPAGLNSPIVSVFVDDIKIMGIKGSESIARVKRELAAGFLMIDLGPTLA